MLHWSEARCWSNIPAPGCVERSGDEHVMDERFSHGPPSSLSPQPGLYQGFKGVQITHTSLATAIRHWSAPSLIHSLPTEQFNQDIVSLGTHSALTAMDVTRLLRSAAAITLLSTAQAVDLRDGGSRL